jgi:hypothetical protein
MVRQSFDAPRPGPDEPVKLAMSPEPRALHLFDVTTGSRIEVPA